MTGVQTCALPIFSLRFYFVSQSRYKISLEKEIKDIDAEIKLKKIEAKKTLNLELKVKSQREIKELENKRSDKRKRLFQAQDEIDERKENLLSEIEQRLNQKIIETELFTIRWKLI